MKKLSILLIATLFSTASFAQAKNYKPVIKELNKMLKDAEEFSWMYEPTFEIVQPYAVRNDTLSVIINGIHNELPVTHKYEAPLADLYDYVHDLYYVLSFKSDSVIVSELQGTKWVVIEKRNHFHLGKPKDGERNAWGPNFRKLLNAVYPLANEYESLD